MCYFKEKPVGEYCSYCQQCSLYLSVCVPIVVNNGVVVAECDDFCFCDCCPCYSECEMLWGKEER